MLIMVLSWALGLGAGLNYSRFTVGQQFRLCVINLRFMTE